MFVKLTSGFLLPAQLIRNLVLQDFSVTGSKSCKLEVTFAIHLCHISPPPIIYNWKGNISDQDIFFAIAEINFRFV